MPEEIATGTGGGGAAPWNPAGTLPESPLLGTGYDVGVQGEASYGTGVRGYSQSGAGVTGTSLPVVDPAGSAAAHASPTAAYPAGDGVAGQGLNGVHGSSVTPNGSGVLGEHAAGGAGVTGSSVGGAGIVGSSKTGKAGLFHGDVEVATGSFTVADGTASFGTVDAAAVKVSGTVSASDVILTGADFAEEFDLGGGGRLEPGTVVVLDDAGALSESALPYNRKVAGVISGAGSYRPAVVLDRREDGAERAVIALAGKVYCKVDAGYGPVEVGDLLTTSPTVGYAMKAQDPARAFGSVLGKALAPLREGCALIPILVVLQ